MTREELKRLLLDMGIISEDSVYEILAGLFADEEEEVKQVG